MSARDDLRTKRRRAKRQRAWEWRHFRARVLAAFAAQRPGPPGVITVRDAITGELRTYGVSFEEMEPDVSRRE